MTDMERYAAEAIEEWRKKEREEKILRYRHLNKMVKKGQILFCGSSLMEQFPVCELLEGLRTGDGRSVLSLSVYNRGVGGYTTMEMADMLDVLVFDLEPAYIFINIGSNDLNAEDYREEGLIERYDDILTRIRKRFPEAGLYIMAYYPCNEKVVMEDPARAEHFGFRTNERIRQANAAVERLSQKHRAAFLDLNSGIRDSSGGLKEEYTTDGIHIYGDGYMRVLEQLLPTLKGLK